MMRDLMYKEWRLSMQVPTALFTLMGFMLFIPYYPYLIIFFYATLGIFFVCIFGRENHDVEYTALLPVTRRQLVGARILVSMETELLTMGITALIGIVRRSLPYASNEAGMNPNLAFYGFALLLLGVFNVLFFPLYYRNPYKVGVPYVISSVIYGVLMVLCEGMVMLPASPLHVLDGYAQDALGLRWVMFGIGAAAYVLLTYVSWRISAKRFELVDLTS